MCCYNYCSKRNTSLYDILSKEGTRFGDV